MATSTYLVIRLVPDSPVDGATFSTYLNDLEIDVFEANKNPPNKLGSTPKNAVPVILGQVPGTNQNIGTVSRPTFSYTKKTNGDYGNTLSFDFTSGIAVGSYLFNTTDPKFFADSPRIVKEVKEKTVTLNDVLQHYVPKDTICSFITDYTGWTSDSTSLANTFQTTDKSDKGEKVLKLNGNGIFPGMSVSGPGIDTDTMVTEVNETTVTLNNSLTSQVSKNTNITFSFKLPSGIVQHFEPITVTTILGWPLTIGFTSASVATVVILLSNLPTPSTPLNITVYAKRTLGTDVHFIPVDNDFYNVLYLNDTLPTPDQFQSIALASTALYISLPEPPKSKAIDLTIPSNGSPPIFEDLLAAMYRALNMKPLPDPATLAKIQSLTKDDCHLLAYEIIWSQRNTLPEPPDPLEQLYTNPPNTGASKGDSGNDEQDRKKFEGTLSSFYATRNASAEHLTKFVVAAATAVANEQTSINAKQAILDFPVDPELITNKVYTEVLLTGLNDDSVRFGVPAAYFYAVGVNFDKSTTAERRYQIATGETVERLLQEIGTVIGAKQAINDTEKFITSTTLITGINSAQAARRLSALGIAGASNSPPLALPPTPLPAKGTFVQVVQAWLLNPPADVNGRTYQTYKTSDDDKIWRQNIYQNDHQAYLNLVLLALTQSYIITDGSKPPFLADKIATTILPNQTVEDLRNLTEQDWTVFFTKGKIPKETLPWLPPFTQQGNPDAKQIDNPKSGYIAKRIKAFVRAVQRFFTLSTSKITQPAQSTDSPPNYDLPSFDAISLAVGSYDGTGTFKFGSGPLDETQLAAAVQNVFTDDSVAKAWLTQAMKSINELYQIAKVVSSVTPNVLPVPASLEFSIVEALYARGFKNAKDITSLLLEDFQQVLTGTVAYPYANNLYQAAQGLPPSTPSTGQGEGTFQPINPGNLTNCLPPPCLSPLGPIAYLKEMLSLTENSTCNNLGTPAQQARESQTLDTILSKRRGALSSLLASCANLETSLPLIDIVNENLENLVSMLGKGETLFHGVVYNTAADKLGDHLLCVDEETDSQKRDNGCNPCHDPVQLFAAIPQYSTPAVPVQQPSAYDKLKTNYSSPCLPYSQPLDISRNYQQLLCFCRFDTMRTFRRYISEFALDPNLKLPDFQAHLWRYPVRIELAIEYLGLTPEDYSLFFNQETCQETWKLYGYRDESSNDTNWVKTIAQLGQFLERTGLSYCEFLELQKSGFILLKNTAKDGAFPGCMPCCPDKITIDFGQDIELVPTNLCHLAIFIRLWRRLREACIEGLCFAQLADICTVLVALSGGLNADFIRHLAALLMLRDHFGLPLACKHDSKPGATAVGRIPLLALWGESSSGQWNYAVDLLLDCIQDRVQRHYHSCCCPEQIKVIADNLDPLSQLCGFDPKTKPDTWHARPSSTLRFAEVLAKIIASDFDVDELLFLFTAQTNIDCDDHFPFEDQDDVVDLPLGKPGCEHPHSLWSLQEKLLAAEVCEEEEEHWTWARIVTAMKEDFGYVPPAGSDPLLSVGQHFFPHILEAHGQPVTFKQRQYRVSLGGSSPVDWNEPPGSPFSYDDKPVNELWTQIPLSDEAVIAKLSQMRQLTVPEQQAVQDLYFLPRVDLAFFSFMFPDFGSAGQHLIQEHEGHERWVYFRRHFALAHKRCHIIAKHLASHVAHITDDEDEQCDRVAWCVLKNLFADENQSTTPWEADTGEILQVTWNPLPNGGAFQALLKLMGTGLLGDFTGNDGQQLIWRETTDRLDVFGHLRNMRNSPAPTILPDMNLQAAAGQSNSVVLRNGYLSKVADGTLLGGAEGFSVNWSGVFLIEHEGEYTFHAGAPTDEGEKPDCEAVENRQWRVTLARGQKKWILLKHGWDEDREPRNACLRLRHGAYRLSIEFRQAAPDFTRQECCHPQHSGFELKYVGPDSGDCLVAIPLKRLFRDIADGTLDKGVIFAQSERIVAKQFLQDYFTGSLRDIRRTYLRAFKAVLFAERFELSAIPSADGCQSELGYMLANPSLFAGVSYYLPDLATRTFKKHAAGFSFNFLPLNDAYNPPDKNQDDRVQPSYQRTQAMFDWWERIFDYAHMRCEVREEPSRQVWLLFQDAQQPSADPARIVCHIGVEFNEASVALSYYDDIAASPGNVYKVTAGDLQDDRWAVRTWHAEVWLLALLCHFKPKDIAQALPCLWAADDPNADIAVPGLPLPSQSGNSNLTRFVADGLLENGQPCRYEEIKRINNGLRERGRKALIAYFSHEGSGGISISAQDLSDFLLIDVETGLCEKASRIEEAVTTVQNFVRRARLGLEAEWNITREFALLWDRRFATFRDWQVCKQRELYQENWIEWGELDKARRIEAFRFLESELRSASLAIAEPGGEDWWLYDLPPTHPGVKSIETRQATIKAIPNPKLEGFAVLGTPERAARPSWLSVLSAEALSSSGGEDLKQNNDALPNLPSELPFWLESAVRLGTKFIRVAAAGEPLASSGPSPRNTQTQENCCSECGRVHPPLVDEYYFWLVETQYYSPSSGQQPGNYQFGFQDSYYDSTQQQSVLWDDSTEVPHLLHWPSTPAVRLAWCRIHNGEYGQPRNSVGFVALDPMTDPKTIELIFLGRLGDSLYFSLNPSPMSPEGFRDGSPSGFRYDLSMDEAVTLPLAVALPNPPPPSNYPGSLPAYPFFAYDEPGERLYPNSFFSPAIIVAETLRARCRFEPALNWYRLAFDPLKQDCTWIDCSRTDNLPEGQRGNGNAPRINAVADEVTPGQMACCDSTTVSADVARNRAITLHYCQTLMDWGDALMRHRHRPEGFQQARLIYDTAAKIMGKRPDVVCLQKPVNPETIANFSPAIAPLNPRLIGLYDLLEDRLGLLHACLDARRLRNGRPVQDMPYFGDNTLPESWQHPDEHCLEESEWCYLHSPYRFVFLIQKALELAGKVKELGSELLSAFEKGDAESLAMIRAGHEHDLLSLGLAIRKDQWRDADWQIQVLQQTKDLNQTNLLYYSNLLQNDLINNEIQHLNLATTALQTHTESNSVRAEGQLMKTIADIFIGFPCNESQIPIGTKLAGVFETIAAVMNIFGDIQSQTSAIDMTLAGWQRRSDEWQHQTQVLPIEIEQIELQILGAQRRRDQALLELNNHSRQIEHSKEVLNFLRDKFTSDSLYLYLQKETAALHYKMYELAQHCARQAERAFNFERGHTNRRFIPDGMWDSLHEGLLAGERLDLALRRMEKAYYDENVREYELTKHFSLRLQFPTAYVQLRTTGYCEIDIPEWMFDLDYPSHYMRRIKNVTLTIPCVTGPYTGVHCRLTLLSSKTRIDPRVPPVAKGCCSHGIEREACRFCGNNTYVVSQYGACEAIATSSGQNDSGLLELNFHDERYLPFEFFGAVSRWRIELPPEHNYFDLDTLTDLILNLNFMAREGGEMLRRAAFDCAKHRLPDDGWRFFDLRHDFPDAWHLFREAKPHHEHQEKTLDVRLRRSLFPFLPGNPTICIGSFVLLFETEDCCPPGEFCIGYRSDSKDTCGEEHELIDIKCVPLDCERPNLFCGTIPCAELEPIPNEHEVRHVSFRFPEVCGRFVKVFLLCRYGAIPREHDRCCQKNADNHYVRTE